MRKYYLVILAVIFLSCFMGFKNLSENEKKYIMTYEDFLTDKKFSAYKLKPIAGGKDYTLSMFRFFNASITTYSFSLYGKDDESIDFVVNVTISGNQKFINDNFDPDKKNINVKYLKNIDLDYFNCIDGIYMNDEFIKRISLKRKNLIYNIVVFGNFDIDLLEYKEIIKSKLDYFNNIK